MLKSWSRLLSLEFAELKNISNDHNLSQTPPPRRKPDKPEPSSPSQTKGEYRKGGYTYGYAYDDVEAKNADALLKRVRV